MYCRAVSRALLNGVLNRGRDPLCYAICEMRVAPKIMTAGRTKVLRKHFSTFSSSGGRVVPFSCGNCDNLALAALESIAAKSPASGLGINEVRFVPEPERRESGQYGVLQEFFRPTESVRASAGSKHQPDESTTCYRRFPRASRGTPSQQTWRQVTNKTNRVINDYFLLPWQPEASRSWVQRGKHPLLGAHFAVG